MPQVTVSRTFDSEAEAAAWLTGGKPSGSTANATSTKAADKPSGPKHHREQLAAAMDKLKAKTSPDVCRALIAEAVGKPSKLAEVPEDKIDAVFDAATKKLAEVEAAAAEEV